MPYFDVHHTSRIWCQSTAAASKPRTAVAAVRRSLVGLPLHRSAGTPVLLHRGLMSLACERTKQRASCLSAGGLLIAPVLQPQTDNIPFGLVLTLHSQAQKHQQAVLPHDDNLYELQYVLEYYSLSIRLQFSFFEQHWLCFEADSFGRTAAEIHFWQSANHCCWR